MIIHRILIAACLLTSAGCYDGSRYIHMSLNGAGTGSGRIISAPGYSGLNCTVGPAVRTGTCAYSYYDEVPGDGDHVLSVIPDAGSSVGVMSGCVSRSAGTCSIEWAGSRTDESKFVTIQFDLIPPPGVQSVQVTPPSSTIDIGASLPLAAAVALDPGASGTPTISWSVSGAPNIVSIAPASGNTTTVTAIGPGSASITAIATLQLPGGGTSTKQGTASIVVNPPPPAPTRVRITVNGTGDGDGVIRSSGIPGGDLNCISVAGVSGGTCQVEFDKPSQATSYTLTQTPAAPSTFTSWTGCTAIAGSACQVTVGGSNPDNPFIAARFNKPGILVRIIVSNGGVGTGTVTGAGLACSMGGGGMSGTCQVDYAAPDGAGSVGLSAAFGGNPPSTFRGWSGDCSGASPGCVLQWNSDLNLTLRVTATFDLPVGPPVPPPPPPILLAGDLLAVDLDNDGVGPMNADLYLVSANTITRLTSDPAPETEPAWSPNGQSIAFRSKRLDALGEIHVINADGTNERRITNNPDFDHDPSWSPDGTKILFVSFRSGDDEIWVTNADGSGTATNLTNTPGVDELAPAMSPDGTRILYVRDTRIWVMNAGGSGQTPLTSGGDDDEPAWSPDGSMIAFSRNSQIWVMNADGSNLRQRTSNNSDDEPAWSPDGTRIVFSRGTDGNRRIWGFRLTDGLGSEQLVSGVSGSSEHPSWRRP